MSDHDHERLAPDPAQPHDGVPPPRRDLIEEAQRMQTTRPFHHLDQTRPPGWVGQHFGPLLEAGRLIADWALQYVAPTPAHARTRVEALQLDSGRPVQVTLPSLSPGQTITIHRPSQALDEGELQTLGNLVAMTQAFIERFGEGNLAVSRMNDDEGREWCAVITFGREAPDSDMAAGQAIGMGLTLADALRGALAEAGEKV
jgi:hypothetical protein